MSSVPAITGKQLVAALRQFGFEVARIKGSHYFMRHADGRASVVPVHAGDTIGIGLLGQILRDTKLTRGQLQEKL